MPMEKNMRITKQLNIRYFFLQMLFWGAAVVNYAYMTPIMENKGFTEIEIGILNAAKLLAGVIFQIWVGSFADRYAKKVPLKYLLALFAGVTAVLSVALYFVSHDFFLMFFISLGFGMSFVTISPLLDSLSMLYVEHGYPVNYAFCRTGGSLSWAVLCVLAGFISDHAGTGTLPLIQLALAFVMTLLLLSLYWENMEQTGHVSNANVSKVHTVKEILTDYPQFSLFLLASAIMFMGYNLGTTFLVDVITGLGGTHTDYGMAELVMSLSEIPSAFIILKLRRKIPITKMMVCCAVFMTFKNVFPTYTDSVTVVILSQVCELLGFGLFYAGTVYLVSSMLPHQDMVKGMTLISVATVGLGEGVASVFCGIIRKYAGLYGLMEVSVMVSAVSVIFMVWMCRKKK